VIDVALLSVIRRWHLRDGLTIKEITRRTGLSRNTVRKYLRSGVTEPRYPKRLSPSKLDAYAETLERLLEVESGKHRKSRRDLKAIHEELVKLGYCGSYDRVAAFARSWRQSQREREQTASRNTYIPLKFSPGEAYQFDWSEEWVVIAGLRTKLQVAQMKLSYSRAFILRAYPLQTQEMLFDAHYHAFRVLGGVARRGIYDNLKTAVIRVGKGKQRDLSSRFQAMASYYLFEANFCNPAAGWEKGQIEKTVRDSRHRLWQHAPEFRNLAEVNAWLEERCLALWDELQHPELPISIATAWSDERALLMPVPCQFDGFVDHEKRVSPTCLISFGNVRYSVPAPFANRKVTLYVYPEKLVVVADGGTIAEHARIIQRQDQEEKTIYDWRHYLAVLERKPGALRNGAPFSDLPDAFKQLQSILLKRPGGDREMVEILSLVLHHDEQAVLVAVELALEAGAPSKPHILNVLARLTEPPRPGPIQPPPGLGLTLEPEANVSRYDHLREVAHGA
jgi:transposase